MTGVNVMCFLLMKSAGFDDSHKFHRNTQISVKSVSKSAVFIETRNERPLAEDGRTYIRPPHVF